jgi:hypothetical protein
VSGPADDGSLAGRLLTKVPSIGTCRPGRWPFSQIKHCAVARKPRSQSRRAGTFFHRTLTTVGLPDGHLRRIQRRRLLASGFRGHRSKDGLARTWSRPAIEATGLDQRSNNPQRPRAPTIDAPTDTNRISGGCMRETPEARGFLEATRSDASMLRTRGSSRPGLRYQRVPWNPQR